MKKEKTTSKEEINQFEKIIDTIKQSQTQREYLFFLKGMAVYDNESFNEKKIEQINFGLSMIENWELGKPVIIAAMREVFNQNQKINKEDIN